MLFFIRHTEWVTARPTAQHCSVPTHPGCWLSVWLVTGSPQVMLFPASSTSSIARCGTKWLGMAPCQGHPSSRVGVVC